MPQRINERTALSTTEASEIIGVSPAYIQRLLRDERLEGAKLGPVWFVYEDSLTAFFANPRKRGPKGPRTKPEQNHNTLARDATNEREQKIHEAQQPFTPRS